MLNVTEVRQEIHTENLLVVGVDVSKDTLNLYAEHTDQSENRRRELDGQIANRTDKIEAMLCKLADYAEENGLDGLLVVCEPTGGYEEQLLERARRLGHQTAYVNGEHVASASVIDPDGCRDRANPTGWTPGSLRWLLRWTKRKSSGSWRGNMRYFGNWAGCTRPPTRRLFGPGADCMT